MPAAGPRAFPGDISVDLFLREYWQKKPLLARQAFPGISAPLSPEELAGLACEVGVNARLVFEHHDAGHWFVQHGPFDENDFSALPDSHWTLLVSDVEKHLPEAAALVEPFRFIPDWRIDDLMVSWAVDGGSVGPHTDAYDVFLVQLKGKRRWQISTDYRENYVDGTELRILADFSAGQDWLLEPGDMLYLPPNIAHHGIAVGECMTCSVGFRAPSYRQLLGEFAETIAAGIADDLRYRDPDLQPQANPGEIDPGSLQIIRTELARRLIMDEVVFTRWFGEFVSDNRAGVHAPAPAIALTQFESLLQLLRAHSFLDRAASSRFLFVREQQQALLFVDGLCYQTGIAFAECLCQDYAVASAELIQNTTCEADRNTLLELYNRGCLFINSDD